MCGLDESKFRLLKLNSRNQNNYYVIIMLIPKFIELMKNGDGTFSRDFTYIDNVV